MIKQEKPNSGLVLHAQCLVTGEEEQTFRNTSLSATQVSVFTQTVVTVATTGGEDEPQLAVCTSGTMHPG